MNTVFKLFREHRLFPCSNFPDANAVWNELQTVGTVRDRFEAQLVELFRIRLPHLKSNTKAYQNALADFLSRHQNAELGNWVWFP